MSKVTKRVAYITQDCNGWFYCDDDLKEIDAAGGRHISKAALLQHLRHLTDYTHYRVGARKPRKL